MIRPLGEYIVAQQPEAETVTASGIVLPEQAQQKPKIAKVLAVGKDVKEVKKGDLILYRTFSTVDIEIDDNKYLMLKEEDALGVKEK